MVKAIKENENGNSAEEISLELGINKATFYNHTAKSQVGKRSLLEWKSVN